MLFSEMAEELKKVLTDENGNRSIFCVSDTMAREIDLWSRIYKNRAPWLSNKVYSCNLAAAIAAEFARLMLVEFTTTISGDARAKYLDKEYVKILPDLQQNVEFGCAKGGLIFKPYVTNGKMIIQAIQADGFFPVAFDSVKNLRCCVFTDHLLQGDTIFTRVEKHELIGDRLKITNSAFSSKNKNLLGKKISLQSVPIWGTLKDEVTYTGAVKLPIGYFKVPLANATEPESPLGVSVFSRAIGQIERADKRYSQIDWEYEAKEAAIHIGQSFLIYDKDKDDFTMPSGKDRLYRVLEASGVQDKPLLESYSPEIRDSSLYNGLNNELRLIEFNTNLAYGTLSDPQNVDKTATEIKSSKQRSYAMVKTLQTALQNALTDLVGAMDFWATIYKLAPTGKYDIKFNWGDSVMTDSEIDRANDRQDLSIGVMQDWEYRMKWYGETENDAKKIVAESKGITYEGDNNAAT